MEESDSDYILSSQTLREIQRQEENEQNRKENEENEIEICGSQEFIEESPSYTSFQHKSVSDRMRIATQKQQAKKKLEKTRSDSVLGRIKKHARKNEEIEISSLSRLINKELEDVDFSTW